MPDELASAIDAQRAVLETRNERVLCSVLGVLTGVFATVHTVNYVEQLWAIPTTGFAVVILWTGTVGLLALRLYLRGEVPYYPQRKFWISILYVALPASMSFAVPANSRYGYIPLVFPLGVFALVIMSSALRLSSRAVAITGVLCVATQVGRVLIQAPGDLKFPLSVGSFFLLGACTVITISVVGSFLSLLRRVLAAEHEHQRMQGLFGRMVSPQVMQHVLKSHGDLKLGGVRRRITVLFCDINDFTPTCERCAPEEVIGMLNAYFEEMVAIIFRHGGTVKQFVGDEIMAIYGAPEDQPDHAARAVRTAVEMIARLSELREQGGFGFCEVKIGVHTGTAVVGSVGSDQRWEYAAVGDDVNLGARIEQLTKQLGSPLLISETTRQEAEHAVDGLEWVSCGPQRFKGKTETMAVYRVERR